MKMLKLQTLMPWEFVSESISLLLICRPFRLLQLKCRKQCLAEVRNGEDEALRKAKNLSSKNLKYCGGFLQKFNCLSTEYFVVTCCGFFFVWVALFHWPERSLISLDWVMQCVEFHTVLWDYFAGFVILPTCNQNASLSRGSRGSSLSLLFSLVVGSFDIFSVVRMSWLVSSDTLLTLLDLLGYRFLCIFCWKGNCVNILLGRVPVE